MNKGHILAPNTHYPWALTFSLSSSLQLLCPPKLVKYKACEGQTFCSSLHCLLADLYFQAKFLYWKKLYFKLYFNLYLHLMPKYKHALVPKCPPFCMLCKLTAQSSQGKSKPPSVWQVKPLLLSKILEGEHMNSARINNNQCRENVCPTAMLNRNL